MEVAPAVHSIAAAVPFYSGPYPPNVYLVAGDGEGALIDSGFGDDGSVQARLDYLAGLPGLRIAYIIVTHHHWDHAGGAHRLRQATGAQVAMHQQEVPFLQELAAGAPQDLEATERDRALREAAARAKPELLLAGDEVLSVGSLELEAIHAPGHTMGSLCLYLRQGGVLFTGDTILGIGTVAISPPPYGDMGLYLESLERLKSYDIALICPGHGPPVRDAARKIQELIDHRRQREEQIVAAVAGGEGTVPQLLAEVYPELDRRLLEMARRQILAHLHKLAKEGRLALVGEGEAARASLR
ncbi:MAG: MBL fold metallo-hydrolase [Dehalococcoidia bacterium]